MSVLPLHGAPVAVLNPAVDVQPAGMVAVPLHDTPVVVLYPAVDVQPAGTDCAYAGDAKANPSASIATPSTNEIDFFIIIMLLILLINRG